MSLPNLANHRRSRDGVRFRNVPWGRLYVCTSLAEACMRLLGRRGLTLVPPAKRWYCLGQPLDRHDFDHTTRFVIPRAFQ